MKRIGEHMAQIIYMGMEAPPYTPYIYHQPVRYMTEKGCVLNQDSHAYLQGFGNYSLSLGYALNKRGRKRWFVEKIFLYNLEDWRRAETRWRRQQERPLKLKRVLEVKN